MELAFRSAGIHRGHVLLVPKAKLMLKLMKLKLMKRGSHHRPARADQRGKKPSKKAAALEGATSPGAQALGMLSAQHAGLCSPPNARLCAPIRASTTVGEGEPGTPPPPCDGNG